MKQGTFREREDVSKTSGCYAAGVGRGWITFVAMDLLPWALERAEQHVADSRICRGSHIRLAADNYVRSASIATHSPFAS